MSRYQRWHDGSRRRASEPGVDVRRTFPRDTDWHSGPLPVCGEEHRAFALAVEVPRANTVRVHQRGDERTRAPGPRAGVTIGEASPRGIRHSKRRPPIRRTSGTSIRSPILGSRGQSRSATAETCPSQLDGHTLVGKPSFGHHVGVDRLRSEPREDQGLKVDEEVPLFHSLDAVEPVTPEQNQTIPSMDRPNGRWVRESIREGRRNRAMRHQPTILAAAPGRSEAKVCPEKPTVDETGVVCGDEPRELDQSEKGNSAQACRAQAPLSADGEWADEIKIRDEQIRVLKEQLAALGEQPMEEIVTLDVSMLVLSIFNTAASTASRTSIRFDVLTSTEHDVIGILLT